MAQFTVYTTARCPYCTQAKAQLQKLGHSYTERSIENSEIQDELMGLTDNRVRTVPQIFIKDYHIGGYDDLMKLIHGNELDMIVEMTTS